MEDVRCFLKANDESIKSLELPVLRKVSPVFNVKHKEVTKQFDKLERGKDELKQILATTALAKTERQTLLAARKHAYEELCVRGNKAKQELEKVNAMCPIYQFQMSNFLKESYRPETEKSDDLSTPPNVSITGDNIIQHNGKLQDEQGYTQNIFNEFVREYLDC